MHLEYRLHVVTSRTCTVRNQAFGNSSETLEYSEVVMRWLRAPVNESVLNSNASRYGEGAREP